jgi:hypothetical protein
MKQFRAALFALPLLVLPTLATADEPVDTVRVLIDMAAHNSGAPAEGQTVYQEYFSSNMLLRFFSKDFNTAYGQAFLRINDKREELMLDWDPIIGGQDSCPLKDITYGKPKETAGKIAITVTFNASSCFGEGNENLPLREVTFTLVKEEMIPGSPLYLIDDIGHTGEPTLKTTLGEMGR